MNISKHPLYHTWCGMVRRCKDPKCLAYPDYGSKGIDVYGPWAIKGKHGTTLPPQGFDNWLSYVTEHLGDRPQGYTLDRIDGSGDYKPGNIRWASLSTQNRNRVAPNGDLRCIRQVGKKGRYKVEVNYNKVKYYIGTFDTLDEAVYNRDTWYDNR